MNNGPKCFLLFHWMNFFSHDTNFLLSFAEPPEGSGTRPGPNDERICSDYGAGLVQTTAWPPEDHHQAIRIWRRTIFATFFVWETWLSGQLGESYLSYRIVLNKKMEYFNTFIYLSPIISFCIIFSKQRKIDFKVRLFRCACACCVCAFEDWLIPICLMLYHDSHHGFSSACACGCASASSSLGGSSSCSTGGFWSIGGKTGTAGASGRGAGATGGKTGTSGGLATSGSGPSSLSSDSLASLSHHWWIVIELVLGQLDWFGFGTHLWYNDNRRVVAFVIRPPSWNVDNWRIVVLSIPPVWFLLLTWRNKIGNASIITNLELQYRAPVLVALAVLGLDDLVADALVLGFQLLAVGYWVVCLVKPTSFSNH